MRGNCLKRYFIYYSSDPIKEIYLNGFFGRFAFSVCSMYLSTISITIKKCQFDLKLQNQLLFVYHPKVRIVRELGDVYNRICDDNEVEDFLCWSNSHFHQAVSKILIQNLKNLFKIDSQQLERMFISFLKKHYWVPQIIPAGNYMCKVKA